MSETISPEEAREYREVVCLDLDILAEIAKDKSITVEGTRPVPDIPFTQYLRPTGERRLVSIAQPPRIVQMAADLRKQGFHFECEMLVTGQVYLDCCDDENQIANEIVPNDEHVPEAITRLVQRAYENSRERRT